jgi:hypothetical protein
MSDPNACAKCGGTGRESPDDVRLAKSNALLDQLDAIARARQHSMGGKTTREQALALALADNPHARELYRQYDALAN